MLYLNSMKKTYCRKYSEIIIKLKRARVRKRMWAVRALEHVTECAVCQNRLTKKLR